MLTLLPQEPLPAENTAHLHRERLGKLGDDGRARDCHGRRDETKNTIASMDPLVGLSQCSRMQRHPGRQGDIAVYCIVIHSTAKLFVLVALGRSSFPRPEASEHRPCLERHRLLIRHFCDEQGLATTASSQTGHVTSSTVSWLHLILVVFGLYSLGCFVVFGLCTNLSFLALAFHQTETPHQSLSSVFFFWGVCSDLLCVPIAA